MTKTCGKCGHAALDDQAQFCNRCGAAVPEERKPAFPVCPGCGTVVSDELAQFCNRCGAGIPPVPVVCGVCGNPAIDNQSRFCTRCGTTFEQKPAHKPHQRSAVCPSCGSPDPHGEAVYCNRCGTPFNRQEMPSAYPPVVVTQRKPAAPHPQLAVPDSDWEPWNDVPPALGISRSEPPIPERPVFHDQQVAVPQKRYAHLPLIADELKKKGDDGARLPISDPGTPQKKRGAAQKKGVLGFLKK